MSEVFGIDVSHHNGSIDWEEVAADDKKFAIMKCQYEAKSHRIDEYFEHNYEGAGRYGIARGVYIYIARASMEDPELDARCLLNHLKNRPLEYGIWLDLEDASLAVKDKSYIRDLVFKYSDIFKKADYYVGIYCNKDWYTRLIHDDLKQAFDFWIARYPSNDTGRYNFSSSLKPLKYAVAWQYSSKGFVPGIKTRCDLNVDFDGTIKLIASSKPSIASNPYQLTASLMKKGSTGESVKWLQWKLNNLFNENLTIDGVFGENTYKAVCKFQKANNLTVDGIVGKNTLTALGE